MYHIRSSDSQCTTSNWLYSVQDSANSKIIRTDGAYPFPSVGEFKITEVLFQNHYQTIQLHSTSEPFCTIDSCGDCRVSGNSETGQSWEAIPVACDCKEDVNADKQCYLFGTLSGNHFLRPGQSISSLACSSKESAGKFVFEPVD